MPVTKRQIVAIQLLNLGRKYWRRAIINRAMGNVMAMGHDYLPIVQVVSPVTLQWVVLRVMVDKTSGPD